MQSIKIQSENLMFSFFKQNPMAIMDMLLIQYQSDEYTENNEIAKIDESAIKNGSKSVRAFFEERSSIISKIPVPTNELNTFLKGKEKESLMTVENKKLSYSENLKVNILLLTTMDKFVPFAESLLKNTDSDHVKSLDSIVKNNKSLSAYMSYQGSLMYYSLSPSDINYIEQELDKNLEPSEYRLGGEQIFNQLRSIYKAQGLANLH